MRTPLNIFMPFFPCLEAVRVTNYIKRICRITSRVDAVLIRGTVTLNCVGTFKIHFFVYKIMSTRKELALLYVFLLVFITGTFLSLLMLLTILNFDFCQNMT